MTEPTEPERRASEALRGIARAIDAALTEAAGQRMGFMLFVFEFDRQGAASYISNGAREECLAAMKELIHRWEHPDGTDEDPCHWRP
jgi:hypothetical protein